MPSRITFMCFLAASALMGMSLMGKLPARKTAPSSTVQANAGCGLSIHPQPAPAVPSQTRCLRPASASVRKRMTKEAPDLYFDLNSRDLNVRQRSKLANIASALQEILHDFPDLIILIEGHCDGYGPIEDTHRIGIERVDVVRRFLLDFGLPHEHLRTVSLVYRTPQCKTFEEICHEKNCRVHFSAALAVPDSGAEK